MVNSFILTTDIGMAFIITAVEVKIEVVDCAAST